MKLSLIPRVRVNYNFNNLLRSIFVSEKNNKYRRQIEDIFIRYFDVEDIILTSSGRSSLFCILKFLKQKKVIVPAYTCDAVIEAIKLAKKEIIYQPVSSCNFNMNTIDEQLLDDNTIVIATHQYGYSCEIETILSSCKTKGAIVIEDCAAALGTKYNGKKVGTFGDYAFFSFDSSKLLNVPSKGGFIIGKSLNPLKEYIKNELALLPSSPCYKMKHLTKGAIYCLLKNKLVYRIFHYFTLQSRKRIQLPHSIVKDISQSDFYTHDFTEWQAYILLRQAASIDKYINKRKKISEYYFENINNEELSIPESDINATCVRFPIRTNNKVDFYNYCIKNGVDLNFSFSHISSPDFFLEEHNIAQTILNIPFYYDLRSKEIKHIVKVINSYK